MKNTVIKINALSRINSILDTVNREVINWKISNEEMTAIYPYIYTHMYDMCI